MHLARSNISLLRLRKSLGVYVCASDLKYPHLGGVSAMGPRAASKVYYRNVYTH